MAETPRVVISVRMRQMVSLREAEGGGSEGDGGGGLRWASLYKIESVGISETGMVGGMIGVKGLGYC